MKNLYEAQKFLERLKQLKTIDFWWLMTIVLV